MGRKRKQEASGIVFAPRKRRKSSSGVVDSTPAPKEVVLDAAAIEKEFASILNYQRKQENHLLGSFVGNTYKLSDKMIEELIKLPKKFDRIEENVLYAATILGEFVLNFKVVMEISPDFCKAQLFLIEIEQGIDEDIKHLSTLAEMTEIYQFEFRKIVCETWHIYYDDETLEMSNFLYSYLHLQNEEFLFNRELVELLSQLYLVRMLALLDKMGELGDKVRYEYKLLMEQNLEKDPSLAQNFTLQKKYLDFVLKKNKAFEEVLKTEEGLKILQGYSKPLVNVRDKTYPTVLETKKEGKKEAKAPAKAAAKPTVKKKSAPAKKAGGGFVYDWKNFKAASYSAPSGGGGASKEKQTPQKPPDEVPKEKDTAKGNRLRSTIDEHDIMRDLLQVGKSLKNVKKQEEENEKEEQNDLTTVGVSVDVVQTQEKSEEVELQEDVVESQNRKAQVDEVIRQTVKQRDEEENFLGR